MEEKQYQQKVQEYNQSIRRSIANSRQTLLKYIKHIFREATGQINLRRLSWTFSELYREDKSSLPPRKCCTA